jgi:GNAT superfamily N-acetyltransferase
MPGRASSSDYLGDALRLRELERGFVLDHFNMFCQEPWHAKMKPADWCSLLGTIEQEEQAVTAIASIITGNLASHLTLQCVHAPSGCASPQTVGYIHITFARGVELAHLKVAEPYRGQRLGALLIAGAVRAIDLLGVKAHVMKLAVLARNSPARALYQRVGFVSTGDDTIDGIEWKMMAKSLRTKLSWSDFAEGCEGLARVHTSARQRGVEMVGVSLVQR